MLFNRLLGSDETSAAAQASMQRNQATEREAREAVAEGSEKPVTGVTTESADAAEKSVTPSAGGTAPQADGEKNHR